MGARLLAVQGLESTGRRSGLSQEGSVQECGVRSRLRDSSFPGPVPTRSTCSVARHPTVCKETPQFLASLPAEPGRL